MTYAMLRLLVVVEKAKKLWENVCEGAALMNPETCALYLEWKREAETAVAQAEEDGVCHL